MIGGGLARWWREVDRVSLLVMLGLMGAGLLCLLAASPAAAERLDLSDPFYFIKRQMIFAVFALGVILAVSMLGALWARRLAVITVLVASPLVAATLFVGVEVNAAQRWLNVAGLSVQPSEFVKPAFVVTAAWLIASGQRSGAAGPAAAVAGALFMAIAAMLLAQPDFGQTLLLAAVFGGVIFLAGAPWRILVMMAAGMLAVAMGAAAMLPHVAARLRAFLSADVAEQTGHALQAIRRGGLFGVGPGEGTVKRDLPDAHTDFIFAVAAEEFGLVFTLGLIALVAALVLRLLLRAGSVAREQEEPSVSALAAGGLALMIGFQALINVAVNLNLAPPKGMTLPFVSYGGSSLVAMAFTGGLALALTRRAEPENATTATTRPRTVRAAKRASRGGMQGAARRRA